MVRFSRVLMLSLLAIAALAASACNNPATQYIQKASFTLSDDLKSARVALHFTDKVAAPLSATYPIKNYGTVFAIPFIAGTQMFQAGFDLNMDIVYDNDFVQIEPTTMLPNGMPLGLPNPVVQVQAGSIGNTASFLAYADIKGLRWLGMAAMVSVVDQNFPSGLTISQVFLRKKTGAPSVYGSFFGPKLKDDGTIDKPGGLAIFADIRALIEARGKSNTLELAPEKELILSGDRADYYRSRPADLYRLGEKFTAAMGSIR